MVYVQKALPNARYVLPVWDVTPEKKHYWKAMQLSMFLLLHNEAGTFSASAWF